MDTNLFKKELWLNNEKVIKNNLDKEKPCYKLGYCPYGCIVELFPLNGGKLSCGLFGHDCPMYYNAEDVAENKKKEVFEEIMKNRKKKNE